MLRWKKHPQQPVRPLLQVQTAANTATSSQKDGRQHCTKMLPSMCVDTVTTSKLLKTAQARKIEPGRLITHRFKLTEILQAYGTFGKAAENQALKVIIEV